VMYKSPFGPPPDPAAPYPVIFITCPFSTPAGIKSNIFLPLTVRVRLWVV
jgi:hypothetical protein